MTGRPTYAQRIGLDVEFLEFEDGWHVTARNGTEKVFTAGPYREKKAAAAALNKFIKHNYDIQPYTNRRFQALQEVLPAAEEFADFAGIMRRRATAMAEEAAKMRNEADRFDAEAAKLAEAAEILGQ
jgi:hypothetical protein